MKFSTRAGYGLRAVVNLARTFPAKKNVRDISAEEGIPRKYLEQLFRILRKNKIVASRKGRDGGYFLLENPEKTRVGEVIEILEGPIVAMKCHEANCSFRCNCSSSFVWIKLQQQIKKTLYGIKLSNLIK